MQVRYLILGDRKVSFRRATAGESLASRFMGTIVMPLGSSGDVPVLSDLLYQLRAADLMLVDQVTNLIIKPAMVSTAPVGEVISPNIIAGLCIGTDE